MSNQTFVQLLTNPNPLLRSVAKIFYKHNSHNSDLIKIYNSDGYVTICRRFAHNFNLKLKINLMFKSLSVQLEKQDLKTFHLRIDSQYTDQDNLLKFLGEVSNIMKQTKIRYKTLYHTLIKKKKKYNIEEFSPWYNF